jgi:hypothetical protein
MLGLNYQGTVQLDYYNETRAYNAMLQLIAHSHRHC